MRATVIYTSDGKEYLLNFGVQTLEEVYKIIKSQEYLKFRDTVNRIVFTSQIVAISESN